MKNFVTYLRVSTQKQWASGLGLEAQREAVVDFADQRGAVIIAEFVEAESGRDNDRPALTAAMAMAKKNGAELLIAKLDRLSRNMAFIAALMDGGVELRIADMPDASRLLLHVMGAVAEHERAMISARTKAALAAARARGVVLGTAGKRLAVQAIADAAAFADLHHRELTEIRATGARTVREFAAGLNSRGISSPQGGRWGPGNTARFLHRIGVPLQ